MEKGIVFGKGFLGSILANKLGYKNVGREHNPLDLYNLENFIDNEKPAVIVNAIGATGWPNIDWCEGHKEETINSNVIAALNLSMCCSSRKIFFVHLGTGCIYSYRNPGKIFVEDDSPDFHSQFYAKSKIIAEGLLKEFSGLLLRIRLPIDGVPHKKNLIDKLKNYSVVSEIEESLTTVPHAVLIIKELIGRRVTGIYNLVNPGIISPAQIMDRYCELVNPSHKFERLGINDFNLLRNRAHCILSCEKLRILGLELPNIHSAVDECLLSYKNY